VYWGSVSSGKRLSASLDLLNNNDSRQLCMEFVCNFCDDCLNDITSV
jgi:hypothetical protein